MYIKLLTNEKIVLYSSYTTWKISGGAFGTYTGYLFSWESLLF